MESYFYSFLFYSYSTLILQIRESETITNKSNKYVSVTSVKINQPFNQGNFDGNENKKGANFLNEIFNRLH